MGAFAYLRKSVVHAGQHTDSPIIQEGSVRALASRHGDTEVTILSDWDKSGRLGRSKRPGYDRLLRAIESGEAHAVYSYSLSRLARSVKELAALFDLCAQHNVALRIDRDAIDTSTASGKMHAHVLAAVSQFESDVASERQRDRYAAKIARGESIATAKPYGAGDGEDAQVVLDAFHEAGSYSGAARLLNEWGVKPRNAQPRKVRRRDGTQHDQEQAVWWPSSVSVIVNRLEPQATRSSTRSTLPSNFALAKLLRCPTCDTLLTGTRDRLDGKNKGRVRYACRLGSVTPHARVSVSEHLIWPAIQAEARKWERPEVREKMLGGSPAEEAGLTEKRDRILDMYQEGLIDKPERDRRLAPVHEALSRVQRYRAIELAPAGISWDAPANVLNEYLRAIFASIELDTASFQPVRFNWSINEGRADAALNKGSGIALRELMREELPDSLYERD